MTEIEDKIDQSQGRDFCPWRPGAEPMMSLMDILRIVRHHWFVGLFCAALISGSVGSKLMTQQSQYRAESSLVIELATEHIIDVKEVLNTGMQNHNMLVPFMNTHIKRLKSRWLAEQVIDSLEPSVYDRFIQGYIGSLANYEVVEPRPDATALLMQEALEVNWEEDSQAIQIVITHMDPEVAKKLANLYIDQYIEYMALLRAESTSEAVSFLGQEVEELRAKLANREIELHAYRKAKNLVTGNRGESIVSQKLTQLSEAVTKARVRLSGVESRLEQIHLAGDDWSLLMNIPFIGGRADVKGIYAQLQDLRREQQVLNQTYLSRHPKVVENQTSQVAVSDALSHAIEQARQEVSVEHSTVVGELKDLEARLDEAEEDALQMELDLIDYRMLDRQVERLRKAYDALSARYSDTAIAERMELNSVRILDRAVRPEKPVWPNHQKIAIITVCLAGLCFFAVPLGIELVDARLVSFSDIESHSGKRLLGDVRHYPRKKKAQIRHAVLRKDEDLLEPFRTIYSRLRLKAGLKVNKMSFVVTSSLPGEGKSFVSSNLAATFATHGFRVLLVDCDLRKPSLHEFFGQENSHGITAWFTSLGSEQALQERSENERLGIVSVHENLSLLTAGEVIKMPTEILGDSRTADLFSRLKARFDVLIIDTAPVGLFLDATLIGEHTDGCVFVARQFKVSRAKARYSMRLLDDSGTPVLGVVFNAIKDVSAAVGYGRQASNYYGHG